jgi:hypothetical protein
MLTISTAEPAACVRSSDIHAPFLPCGLIDVTEVECITHPHSHLVTRSDRHNQKAFEFRFRAFLAAVSFGNIRTDGFACAPHLIAQRMLFDLRPRQALPMDFSDNR